jgi:signal transduction histidine kinase
VFPVQRRSVVTLVALGGLALTLGLMIGFGWAGRLGTVTLAPWVALIGFDLGVFGGAAGALGAFALWLALASSQNATVDSVQIAVRVGALLVLGVGAGLVGDRLRDSERAQRRVAALQSALIDSTLDGICLTDEHGEILISNRPLRRLAAELGMPTSGTVPDRLLAIADKLADPERYRARMLEIAAMAGEATLDEFELAGTGRVFRGYTSPVETTSGGFVGRIWTLREVTADRELDRMRDAFVATVSHELRTPLTSISGFLEMMQEEEHGLGESGRRYLDVIRRSTNRLHGLVEDLLLVAQIEAQRVELHLAPVDVAEVAASAVEAARPAADEKGVRVEVVLDHPPLVLADHDRLTQVLDNLVSNAVKFTNAGGNVRVEAGAHNGGVRVAVRDTGIGTGLGLAISRALVERHGGTISMSSEVGRGTSVVVTLPATPSGDST